MKLSGDLTKSRDNKYKHVYHHCHYDLKNNNLPERDVTFGYLLSQIRLSVVRQR